MYFGDDLSLVAVVADSTAKQVAKWLTYELLDGCSMAEIIRCCEKIRDQWYAHYAG